MNDQLSPDFDRLLAAAKESRLVIFVGAGASMGSPTNLPSWDDTNRIIIRALEASASEAIGPALASSASEIVLDRHDAKRLPPHYQAEVLSEFLGQRYFEVLRLIDSDHPNANHLAIAWLAKLGCVRAIVTTNFDRLIEKAFAAVGAPLERLYEPEHFTALASNLEALDQPGGPCRLFKIHGSVDDRTTLIDTLKQRRLGLSTPILQCARRLLDVGHWVFIGWGGGDLEAEPNYLSISHRANTARGFTWLVRANSTPSDAVVKLEELYGEKGAIVEGELPAWLLDFSSLISSEPSTWISTHLARAQKANAKSPRSALEHGATRWARELSAITAAMSLGSLVMACSEPRAAATITEALLDAIDSRLSESESPSHGELRMKAIATQRLGHLLAGFGQHDSAISRFNEAMSLAFRAGDDELRDSVRMNLAQSLEARGSVEDARLMYESALMGFRERGNPVGIAFSLSNIAAYFVRQFRPDDALHHANEAIARAKQAGDERQRASALNLAGQAEKLRGNYPAALAIFEEVEKLFVWLGNDDAAAAAAGNRGEVLAELGRFDEAEAVQLSVLETEQRLRRLDNQGATCLSLGLLNHRRGNTGEAERWFSAARDIFAAIGDPSSEALALYRLASLKNDLHQFNEGIELAQHGVMIVSGRNDALTADLSFQLGRASMNVGNLALAEVAFRDVVVVGDRTGATRLVASALQNLGTCLLLTQRDREAANAFRSARDLWRGLNADDAAAYCALGETAIDLDAKIAAISDAGHAATDWTERQAAAREIARLYPDLISMYEQLGATQRLASICVSAASTAEFINEDMPAIEWFMRGASLFQRLGAGNYARSAYERAERLLQHHVNALMQREQMEDAMPLLLQLAEVSGQLGHREAQATAMYNAAIGSIATGGGYDRARSFASQAADLFEADSASADNARRLAAYCSTELERGSA